MLLGFSSVAVFGDSAFASSPNWCTLSPDRNFIDPEWVDFTEPCRNHDICYWIIGADKANCDTVFDEQLKQVCTQTFKDEIPISDPFSTDPLNATYLQNFTRRRCSQCFRLDPKRVRSRDRTPRDCSL